MSPAQLLTSQKIVSTKQFQTQFAKMAKEARENGNFYSIMRNSENIGVFIPQEMWEDFLEDMEALSSPAYLAKIQKARDDYKKKDTVDIDEAFNV